MGSNAALICPQFPAKSKPRTVGPRRTVRICQSRAQTGKPAPAGFRGALPVTIAGSLSADPRLETGRRGCQKIQKSVVSSDLTITRTASGPFQAGCHGADMSDPIVPAVTRQKVEAEGHSRKGTVTGKLRVALDAMIWEVSARKPPSRPASRTRVSVLRCARSRPGLLERRIGSPAHLAPRQACTGSPGSPTTARTIWLAYPRSKALETISDAADATMRPGMRQVAPGLVFYINVGNGNPPRIIDPSASAQIEGESVRRDRSPA